MAIFTTRKMANETATEGEEQQQQQEGDTPIGEKKIEEGDEQVADEDGEEVNTTEQLSEDAQALKDELAKIVVHPPTVEQYEHYFNVFKSLQSIS